MENDKWFDFSKKNESLATKDELMFIFSQAEAQLKESIISGADALTRSTILLSILIGLLTSLIGYFINQLNTNPSIMILFPRCPANAGGRLLKSVGTTFMDG